MDGYRKNMAYGLHFFLSEFRVYFFLCFFCRLLYQSGGSYNLDLSFMKKSYS